jgi:hypothetical protein
MRRFFCCEVTLKSDSFPGSKPIYPRGRKSLFQTCALHISLAVAKHHDRAVVVTAHSLNSP